MAILISTHQLTKAFGARPLFSGLTFTIESGDRIGLIGPNGAGKSTLLRILASEETTDGGTLSIQKNLRVGYLKQIPEFTPGATLLETVMEGVQSKASRANNHEKEHWEEMVLAEECLGKLDLIGSSGFSPETLVETLSGGWKKRVALARELAMQPDLLLLDEPTNHLDVESILWLEDFLAQARFATLTITHDRAFLQNVSNRIIELDRRNPSGLLNIKGSYTDYLEVKNQVLEAQQSRELSLKNTLRRETEWLRRGAKARTTKQQARIYRAEDLKQEVEELAGRNLSRTVRLDFKNSERNPKKLVEAKNISKAFRDRTLFKDFDLIITPGSRIGLLGKNGSGKSTLIQVLLGKEEPDHGTVFRSDQLKLAYFEQNRETLDPTKSVLRTLCPTGDQVIHQGRSTHIRSYLDRFLFEPGQMEMAVGKLSGGEQSRLLIARLMLKEANLLVLDEPTNDLDLATLTILEECLRDFQGALLLVTHDRYFLDQVTNQILAFPSESADQATIQRFADLSQWEEWRANSSLPLQARKDTLKSSSLNEPTPVSPSFPIKKKKLSFKEQNELDLMEKTILKAESEVAKWTEETQKLENMTNPKKLAEMIQCLAKAQETVDKLYLRWTELSSAPEKGFGPKI